MQQWIAQAPSNIALIKYMGKQDEKKNIPANSSLSYTLPHLLSNVTLEVYPGPKDIWEPLEIPGFKTFNLSIESQNRYLSHLQTIKDQFQYQGHFIVRSSNNFAHGSGLASSASSFAALTKCTCIALSELTGKPLPDIAIQAQWSRLGSGSSCRSFFSPWALWTEELVSDIDIPYHDLIHHVILINEEEKAVSSKKAHNQIRTNPEYQSRPARATERLKKLIAAFQEQLWHEAYTICWDEFMDMHNLFETSTPPFSYITPEAHEMLNTLQTFWKDNGDGPIVTMDAGPNIHLLFRQDQKNLAKLFIQEYLVNQYDFI